MRARPLILTLSWLVCLGVSSASSAQDAAPATQPAATHARHGGPLDSLRLGAHFSLGGGGEIEYSGTGLTQDADPTLGFGFRALLPLMTYFSIGAQLEVLWARPETVDNRSAVLDVQLVPEARYPLELGGHEVELYFALPIGFSELFPDDPALDNGPGFALSLLFGARAWITDMLGVYTDLGWGIHHTHNDVRRVGGEVEPIMRQMIFHLGVQLAL